MRISDVLGGTARRVISVEPRDTIADAVYVLKENSIGAVVVTSDGASILGIMSERDIVRHLARELEGTLRVPVEDLMTEDVSTCRLDDDIEAATAVMIEGRFRHMPVLDDDGAVCAVISLGDLVSARLAELESKIADD